MLLEKVMPELCTSLIVWFTTLLNIVQELLTKPDLAVPL